MREQEPGKRFQKQQERRARNVAAIEAFGEPFKDEAPEESERLATQAVTEAREQARRDQAVAPKS